MSNSVDEKKRLVEEILSRSILDETAISPLVEELSGIGKRMVIDVYITCSAAVDKLIEDEQWFDKVTADHRPFSGRPYEEINPRANVISFYKPLTPEYTLEIKQQVKEVLSVHVDELRQTARQRLIALGLEPLGIRIVWALKRLGPPVITALSTIYEKNRCNFYSLVATIECCAAIRDSKAAALVAKIGLGAALLEIREMAVNALSEMEEEELAHDVLAVHEGSTEAAIHLLNISGSFGTELLLAGLCSLDESIARACADGLGSLGEDFVPVLNETAKSFERFEFRRVERLWACRALGRTKSPAAVDTLKWVLTESQKIERDKYEVELRPTMWSASDPPWQNAKSLLMKYWSDDYTKVRVAAIEALGYIGNDVASKIIQHTAKWYNLSETAEVKRTARKVLTTMEK